MDIKIRLGKNVRRIRRSKDLSQEALGHLSDTNRTYISDIERGLRNPSIEVVDRIAQALGIPIGQLFENPISGSSDCDGQ